MMLFQPSTTTTFAKSAYWRSAPAVWNSLLETVNSVSVIVFKSRLKTFLFSPDFHSSLFLVAHCLAPTPLKLRTYRATGYTNTFIIIIIIIIINLLLVNNSVKRHELTHTAVSRCTGLPLSSKCTARLNVPPMVFDARQIQLRCNFGRRHSILQILFIGVD